MTTEPRSETETNEHEPNEAGFAGDPSTPQPNTDRGPDEVAGENVAVPAGDITGAVTEALEGFGGNPDRDENTGAS
jgi:hypothetical protein